MTPPAVDDPARTPADLTQSLGQLATAVDTFAAVLSLMRDRLTEPRPDGWPKNRKA
jgi:hypothetical protein